MYSGIIYWPLQLMQLVNDLMTDMQKLQNENESLKVELINLVSYAKSIFAH